MEQYRICYGLKTLTLALRFAWQRESTPCVLTHLTASPPPTQAQHRLKHSNETHRRNVHQWRYHCTLWSFCRFRAVIQPSQMLLTIQKKGCWDSLIVYYVIMENNRAKSKTKQYITSCSSLVYMWNVLCVTSQSSSTTSIRIMRNIFTLAIASCLRVTNFKF